MYSVDDIEDSRFATLRKGALLCLTVALALGGHAQAGQDTPAAPRNDEPTVFRGEVRDPVDDGPISGARVRVGPRVVRTAADGTFEVRVGRRRTGVLRTVFRAEGYSRYDTWTRSGGESERLVYLFPDHPVVLEEHDEPISPELLREQFDIVYRDPVWRDPRRTNGWLWRWDEQPRVFIASRVNVTVEDENGTRTIAGRKVPGKVRRHVRRVIERAMADLTGGRFEPGRVRFLRMQEGEVIAESIADWYRPGEIHVRFTDSGYFDSGGGHLIAAHRIFVGPTGSESLQFDLEGCVQESGLSECLTIVTGAPVLDLESVLKGVREGRDYLTKHEFAHVLGMHHRMESSHGVGGTLLCSIMGGPCDSRDTTPGAVTHVDRVLARLAYSRPPGNDLSDRDPKPPHEDPAEVSPR